MWEYSKKSYIYLISYNTVDRELYLIDISYIPVVKSSHK